LIYSTWRTSSLSNPTKTSTHPLNHTPNTTLPPPTMQNILVTLSLLASAAVGVLAVDELKIDVTLPVECDRKTQAGDKVSMHYKGTLENGNKFDASYDRGTPFSFKLGSGQVIKGWDEGLQDMCIGEKRYTLFSSHSCAFKRPD